MDTALMFGWRRRNDGFEWHQYVRTTILVRRKERRAKIEEVGQAAIDGIKEAGKRSVGPGASRVKSAGQGIFAASQSGAGAGLRALGVGGAWLAAKARRGSGLAAVQARKGAGFVAQQSVHIARGVAHLARGAGHQVQRGSAKLGVDGLAMVRAGVRRGSDLGRDLGGRLGGKLGSNLKAGFPNLLKPELGLPVGFLALAIAAGAVGEFFTNGLSLMFAGLLGLALIAGTYAIACRPNRLGRFIGGGSGVVGARAGYIGIGVGLVGLLAAGVSWWAGQRGIDHDVASAPVAQALPATENQSSVRGYAKSLTGDTLRIDGTVIRLSGVEAPELAQRCARGRGRTWACGYSALQALRRITGRHNVACEVSNTTATGGSVGTCRIGKKNLAEELVRKGHVFAQSGAPSSIAVLEREAREQKLGIWRGETIRPKAFRSQLWTIAAKKAPKGCPVKGPVLSSRGKVYLMPWTSKYDRFRIRERRGDRWFCSEREALEAGWKPYQRL